MFLRLSLAYFFVSTLPLMTAATDPATVFSPPTGVQGPATLDFEELITLASVDPLAGSLSNKLDRLLTTPFISNEASGGNSAPKAPQIPGLGPILRLAEWNINRGENEHNVELALADSKAFMEAARKNPALKAKNLRRAVTELQELGEADVIILDEVDDGVKRTRYHDVARDLAKALNMNYVYAVEFVELNRIYLGVKNMDTPERPKLARDEPFGLDPKRYLGLEGSAILSRYPIRGARILRLPELYDWYHQEIKEISGVEKARRWTAEQLFEERIRRQVRRGGRMALVVDLEVPQSPTGFVSVVCPHLEDYTGPKGRRRQMDYLLNQIHDISNPVILAGDFNTTGRSAQPITVRKEILKYVTDYRFWAREIFFFAVPLPGLGYAFHLFNYFKNYHDPTVFNLPILLGNRTRQLFDNLERFRFSDGGSFTFEGTRAGRRHHGGTLADSNQRSWKGFTPTFAFKRTFKGLVGEYKIDWFFIKTPPGRQAPGQLDNASFVPQFGRTLQLVNTALGPRISDHCPITVTVPLGSAAVPPGKPQ
jgi:endonuclease/exonuclease/phosphatase family metal-dependent hydrolase